jgi:hypothetical protein
MAGPNYVLDKGFEAAGAISRFHFVKLNTSEQVSQCDAQGEASIGVCQDTITSDDATNGRVAAVRLFGISRVISGDTFSAVMTPVTVGADGRAEPATTGDRVVGYNLQTSVDGDHMDVVLIPSNHIVAA